MPQFGVRNEHSVEDKRGTDSCPERYQDAATDSGSSPETDLCKPCGTGVVYDFHRPPSRSLSKTTTFVFNQLLSRFAAECTIPCRMMPGNVIPTGD